MSLSELVERLERMDPPQLDAGGVAAGFRELERLKGFVAEIEHALARRANALAAAGSGAAAGDLIERAAHCSPREAQRTSRRAEILGALPSMSMQLGKGRIGAEHADAVATVAGRLDEADRSRLLSFDDELACAAASSTPADFRRFVGRVADQLAADRGLERAVRQKAAMTLAKGINDDTGMYWLRAEFDPETGARLFRAIDSEVAGLAKRQGPDDPADRQQLAARALVDLATSAHRSKRPSRVELLALIDIDTLTNGLSDTSTCELHDGTEVPVATLRRLACDAHVIPVVLNGEGVPLDVGRSQRLATDDQRRALRAMYRTCGIGTCDVPFDRCEIHHLDEWDAHRGLTNLDRLIPACSRHHHLAHEGGWHLELDPTTRELTVTLPDGTLHQRSRPHPVTAPTVRPAA